MSKAKIAAAYVRMSTDKQEDSPARQRADIEALAQRGGYTVAVWYEDRGMTGTESKKRGQFQQMLKDATAGKFKALLLSEQSRLSREDLFEQMAHLKVLKDAGVSIVTCQQGEMNFNNLGGLLTTIIGAHGAHDESRKIADRVVSGKRLAMSLGQRQGGGIFGLDREIRDPAGKVLCRVSFRDRFQKPRGHTVHMIPSAERVAVDAVRHAFTAVAAGELLADVKRWFDANGVTTMHGLSFNPNNIFDMLRNPIYCGRVVHGRQSGLKSKFFSVCPDGPTFSESAVPPIVSRELFDTVQAILDARHKKRTRSAAGTYLLVGLLHCGHCGARMYGGVEHWKPGKKIGPRSAARTERFYGCTPHARGTAPVGCPHPAVRRPSIKVEAIERAVISAIRNKVLAPENRAAIAERIAAKGRAKAQPKSADETRLAELVADITAGERNLARAASDADYAAISRNLHEWRTEADGLRAKVNATSGRTGAVSGDARAALERLEWMCENFEKAPRPKLADYLKQAVVRVEVRFTDIGRFGSYKNRVITGTLQLAADLYHEPIVLKEELLPQRVKDVIAFVRAAPKPVTLPQVRDGLKINDKSARLSVRKANQLGLLTFTMRPGKGHAPLWQPAC